MEFLNLGKHCQAKSCKQLDFLPFKCELCSGTFCLDHRKFELHSCPNVHLKKEKQSPPICPMCTEPVACLEGQNRDDVVWQHIQDGCAEGVKRKQKKGKCHVKKCKDVPVIPLLCNDCGYNFCALHRLATDHNCLSRNNSKHNKHNIIMQQKLVNVKA